MTNQEKHDAIIDYLLDFAEENDVLIVAAKEYGSRAWNVESESSDHDLAVIYRQPTSDYITLGNYRENIDRNDVLNVDGEEVEVNILSWNIKRFAELVSKSNPTAIEVLTSDVAYVDDPRLDRLEKHARTCFRPIAMMGHYHSLAKNNYRKYLKDIVIDNYTEERFKVIDEDDNGLYVENEETGNQRFLHENTLEDGFQRSTLDLTVKRNLYVARALAYKRYIEETHSLPSFDFVEFLDNEADVIEGAYGGELVAACNELVHHKKKGDGDKKIGNVVGHFAEDEIERDIPNTDVHNIRGIDESVVNDVVMDIMYDRR